LTVTTELVDARLFRFELKLTIRRFPSGTCVPREVTTRVGFAYDQRYCAVVRKKERVRFDVTSNTRTIILLYRVSGEYGRFEKRRDPPPSSTNLRVISARVPVERPQNTVGPPNDRRHSDNRRRLNRYFVASVESLVSENVRRSSDGHTLAVETRRTRVLRIIRRKRVKFHSGYTVSGPTEFTGRSVYINVRARVVNVP